MKLLGPTLARIALCLVFAVMATSAAAQGENPPTGQGAGSTALEQIAPDKDKGSVISGTGMTAKELRQIGYSDREIAWLMNEANSGELQAGSRDAESPGRQAADKAQQAGSEIAGRTDGGISGLWGLLGLLGLIGLAGRGRRREVVPHVEEERPRGIRRVA
jgi:hypothetical protein